MQYTITTTDLKICRTVSKYAACKLNVEQDDVLSYLLPKILNCKKNYRDDLNNPWDKYLNINLRLYSLNYLRDTKSKGLSSNRALLLKASKYVTLEAASRRLGVPAKELMRMKKEQHSAENQFSNSDLLETYKENYTNIYVDFVAELGGISQISKYTVEELRARFEDYKN